VRDAGAGSNVLAGHLGFEFGHPCGAARALQTATLMYGDAARVVAAVFEALQALDEDRNDVARADCADDAAHGRAFAVETKPRC
jgi:hypothetical protein